MAKEPGQSVPELELANVRTREHLERTVARIKQKSNVPERWRLLVARTKQRLHRDPTPLVAMAVTAVAGVAAIVGGTLIGRSEAGHLDRGFGAVILPVDARGRSGRAGTKVGRRSAALSQDEADDLRKKERTRAKKLQKSMRKRQSKMIR
ncbi:hypothetical protein [Curtobacterium sp. Leaf261]|uniref:hypothetical protein n=1 Tax=Curtobacterium sp. Leaf261 TaxID=1736311 RepID=UPI0006FF8D79|nr:hypothetical protein [Curtobacterium sp. Leaf261]KQO61355.1 hypothetical protein ASF23_12820 [Curtobacterium sp. Leaf261]